MANTLRNLRSEAGLTQKQLADKSGVSVRAIINAEQNKHHLRRASIFALAYALNVTPAEVQQD